MKRTAFVLILGLSACAADMRRNSPAITSITPHPLNDVATCLVREMNDKSRGLTNSISQILNTAPVVTNQVRTIEPNKVFEIGPVQTVYSDWYVVRLTALQSGTQIEFHPGAGRDDVTATLAPAFAACS
jgi:hypothetical protein